MTALIVVDIQNDFLPGGSLGVPRGDEIIEEANALICDGHYELVVATQDWHPTDHMSFAANHSGKTPGDTIIFRDLEQTLWPTHCVQRTRGAEFAQDLKKEKFDAVFKKGTDPAIDSYSGFFDNGHLKATGLGDFLRTKEINEVDVIGLATDYCVKYTALDAVKEGFQTNVIASACRGVELENGDVERAIQKMERHGVVVK